MKQKQMAAEQENDTVKAQGLYTYMVEWSM